MQSFKFYLREDNVLAEWVDAYNQPASAEFPSLARGQMAEIVIGMFADAEADHIKSQEEMLRYSSWDFGLDTDYDMSSTPKVRTTAGFVVDAEGYLHIPLDTATQELAEAMGTAESITLDAELIGYTADDPDHPAIVIQWGGQSIRNRILQGGTGSPAPVDEGTYSKAQVDALVSGAMDMQFSVDGSEWHEVQTLDDKLFRMRNSLVQNAQWSEPIAIPAGREGQAGVSEYVHVAYASDGKGTGFSFDPSDTLKYRAEAVNAKQEATQEDFTGVTWIKYIGDDGLDGTGTGDMMTEVYDPTKSGSVLKADSAKTVETVDWGIITSVPTEFKPSAHTHSIQDIRDGAYQRMLDSGDAFLRTDIPIKRDNSNAGTAIAIDFAGIKDAEGQAVTLQSGDCLTWEVHYYTNQRVTSITIGSTACVVKGIQIPETLELVSGKPSWHVFAVRALHNGSNPFNATFYANYAYSYED